MTQFRCVSRAFFCEEDKCTGTSFEHRRQWMIERIYYLASVFINSVLPIVIRPLFL